MQLSTNSKSTSQKQAQNDKVEADLIQVDEQMARIANLSTNQLQRVTQVSQMRRSMRDSFDMKNKNDVMLKKQVSIDFDEQLNLDMLIQRLLETLTKTKIQLIELDDPDLIKDSEKLKDFKVYFNDQLKKYNKTLLLRQSQLGALIYVIDNKNNEDFKQKYLATYGELDNFIISAQQAKRPINTVILQQAFETEIQFLKQYSDMMTLLKLNLVHRKYMSDMQSLIRAANRLKIINSKIATIAEVFPYACIMDKNDLFSFKKTSDRWHKLLESGAIGFKIYGDKEKMKKSFINLKNGLNIVNATMSIMHRTRQSWIGTAKDFAKDLNSLAESTSKIFKCLIFKQDASHEAQVLISDPNGGLAKEIWNLPQQKMLRNLISVVLPSINFSKQFYIPRIFTQYLYKQGAIKIPQLSIQDLSAYTKSLYLATQYKQRIPMRINSSYNLIRRSQKSDVRPPSVFQNFVKSLQGSKTQLAPSSLIYHIHGGGFISMSSFIHQIYTRVWANNLKVPIISVDYGKAPQYPFPYGLHDCFQGYMWALYNFRQVYDIEPTKIILVGDSAGGNLVAALTNLLIKMKLRVPDGICMVYPALNLNYRNYTPSLLTSLNDMILPHTFLKICLKAYLKQGMDPCNPLVSPIYASDDVLKKYPPTRMFVGSKDPFHDDCCRLTEKLNQLVPNKAKLLVFDEFPHGFLQFDVKTQPHEECRKAVKQVENALGQLLNM